MSTSVVAFDELLGLRVPLGVEVSRDGRRLAFAVAAASAPKGGGRASRIWIGDLGGQAREVTSGPGSDGMPRFSPDARQLAFASDGGHAGGNGLYVLDAAGEARPLGGLCSVEAIHWAATGTELLVLAADEGSDIAGAGGSGKVRARYGEGQDPIVRRPADAWRRLYRVELATGSTTEAGPERVNIWELGWNGAGAVVAVVSGDPGESAWYGASIALLDLERRTARTVYRPEWQVQSPTMSPDGRRAAFVEGLSSDRTVVAGTVTVVDVASGQRTVLAPDHDIVAIRWLEDGESLFGVGLRGLETMCLRIALDGTVEELWRGPATLGQSGRIRAACSGDARVVAAVREAPGEPPEVAVLEAGSWRPLTRLNARFAGPAPPRAERFSWSAADGVEIEGILLRPAERSAEPRPLIVLVHGGPTNAWTFAFGARGNWLDLAMANAGYAVLMPNPRGSAGRGQAFVRAVLGDMGGEDLQDIVTGVDALAEAGTIDPARVGITGGSYGGFISAWAVTQTRRFAASVPRSCVSHWLSFQNTSNIGRFAELFLDGDPYDPTGPYLARSPLMHVRNCTTPTLILHGERDLCTPVGQAQELYQALVDVGCETELVIYPRTGHSWNEREHLIDAVARTRAWFDRHLDPPQ